jgi:ribonuclease D
MTSWIRDIEALRALAERLGRCRAVALDSESDSLHHHVEKVCLLQVAGDDGQVALIDPLALRDLSPLAPLLGDAGMTKVLHGADYDVTTLKRDFGFEFAGLFDTMLAARFLGRKELGLQALCAAELGVTLNKDSQRDDWSLRPLTPRQEHYAAEDVRHLIALMERLRAELVTRGRLAWLEEECQAVAALPAAVRRADPDAWLRVKGASRLAPRALAVLRELVAWREAQAQASDIPAFKILGTETLLALASSPPADAAALGRARGLSPLARRQSADLHAAVRRGLDLPEAECPRYPRPPRPIIPDEVLRRVQALRQWREQEARRQDLDVSVVLPQRLLDKLAEVAPRSTEALLEVPGLRRWRVAAFGPGLLAATANPSRSAR